MYEGDCDEGLDLLDKDRIIKVLRLLKLMYDNGRADIIGDFRKDSFDYDMYVQLYDTAMNTASETAYSSDGDDWCEKWYFSDPAMTEYYRTARKLERLKGIKSGNSEYRKNPLKFMRYEDNRSCFNAYLKLYTGTKRANSSAVVLYISYEYEDFFDFGLYVWEVFEYYRRELKILKGEYASLMSERKERPLMKRLPGKQPVVGGAA